MAREVEWPIFENEAMAILDCQKSDLFIFCEEKVIRSYRMKFSGKLYFFKSQLLQDIEFDCRRYAKRKGQLNQYYTDIMDFLNAESNLRFKEG